MFNCERNLRLDHDQNETSHREIKDADSDSDQISLSFIFGAIIRVIVESFETCGKCHRIISKPHSIECSYTLIICFHRLLIFQSIPVGFLLGHVELLENAGEEQDDLDESQRGGQPSSGRVHVPAQIGRPQRNESRLDGFF